jgi:hypothetical protein
MICTDERIIKVCSEMFHFLISPDQKCEIHRKPVAKRQYRTGSLGCSIEIGFLMIQMIWKPLKIDNDVQTGSDEGANIFFHPPFADSTSIGAARFQITGYYSERHGKPSISILTEDAHKSSPIGTRRVTRNIANVDTSNPF